MGSFIRETLITNYDLIINSYTTFLRNKDVTKLTELDCMQLYSYLPLTEGVQPYLVERIPFFISIILSQLRVANKNFCTIYCHNHSYSLKPSSFCEICNDIYERVDIFHFLNSCPMMNDLRSNFLAKVDIAGESNHVWLKILSAPNKSTAQQLFYYVSNGLKRLQYILDTC